MPCRIAALCVVLATLAPSVRAEPLRVRVDPTTFFQDDPAWLVSLRPALGIEDDGTLWPQLGLGAGYVFPNHLFVGGTVDGRLTEPYHVRAGIRGGLLFRRRALNIGFGTGLSVLAIPRRREVGPVPTTWLDVSLRVAPRHSLSFFAEADVLVEQVGFDESRALFGVGLGWTVWF